MITNFTEDETGDVTIDALVIRVVLTRTRLPTTVVLNVILPRWVLEAQKPRWQSWDWVFAVGDTRKEIQFAVDEVGELLVSNLAVTVLRRNRRAQIKMWLTRGSPYP